jgi:hypothetical protein
MPKISLGWASGNITCFSQFVKEESRQKKAGFLLAQAKSIVERGDLTE